MFKLSQNAKLITIVVIISFFVGGFAGVVFNFLITDLIKTTFTPIVEIFRPKEEVVKQVVSTIEEESATITAVKKISPSVVSVIVTKELSKYKDTNGFEFGDFFFPFEFQAPEGKEKTQVGGGSGFIVSSDGLILTNRHVVSDKDAQYTVITSDGKTYDTKVLAVDTLLDLAIVKIEGQNLPMAELGDSNTIEVGQTIVAIGNALSEYPNTVTKGIVSAKGRRVVAGGYAGSEIIEEAIQIDAAINPGNSGGPIVNLKGEVVGVATAMTAGGQLIAFAIPINAAKTVVESVKKFGKIVRPWLGVRYILINSELKQRKNLPFDYGAWIVRGESAEDAAVIPGSPADKAGLGENNIILEVNGIKVTESQSLSNLLSKYNPGDEITLKVYKKGETEDVRVKLEERRE